MKSLFCYYQLRYTELEAQPQTFQSWAIQKKTQVFLLQLLWVPLETQPGKDDPTHLNFSEYKERVTINKIPINGIEGINFYGQDSGRLLSFCRGDLWKCLVKVNTEYGWTQRQSDVTVNFPRECLCYCFSAGTKILLKLNLEHQKVMKKNYKFLLESIEFPQRDQQISPRMSHWHTDSSSRFPEVIIPWFLSGWFGIFSHFGSKTTWLNEE